MQQPLYKHNRRVIVQALKRRNGVAAVGSLPLYASDDESVLDAIRQSADLVKVDGALHAESKITLTKKGRSAHAKFELKVVNDRLVIDMNAEPEYTAGGMMVRGYDGVPSKYDICDLGPAPVLMTVELTDVQLAKINAEYENGGECDWCGEFRPKLRSPHMFDPAPAKMCEHCWDHDREMYKGSYGEDIGPFEPKEQDETTCTTTSA